MSAIRFASRILPILILGSAGLRSASADSMYPENLYGWYEAGPSLVESTKIRNFPGDEFTDDNKVKFDPGFHFGIAIGRELTRYVSVELESGFNYNALDSISGADSSSAEKRSSFAPCTCSVSSDSIALREIPSGNSSEGGVVGSTRYPAR